ncbi:MAG: type II secretion system F family protein [Halodesulfurarchaeum sp.]
MVLEYVPLIGLALLLLATALSSRIDRLDRAVTQIALGLFGGFARRREQYNHRQVRVLEAAHVGETYWEYASKTYLYAGLVAVFGSIAGVYGFVGLQSLLEGSGVRERVPASLEFLFANPQALGIPELFLVLLASSATLGVVGGVLTVQLRFTVPRLAADERRRRIETSIKRNVAFVFALSRSGMAFPEILSILSRHTGVYGETAREFRVTVKDMDLFGTDLQTALTRMGNRTPSDELEEFVENLGSVLRSGRSIPTYLRDQYDYFLDEEAAHQERFIELLGTLAEAYVTVFVAGFLFLITILFVIGLLIGGTYDVLTVMVYLVLPLATLGFVVYLDTITEDVRESPDEEAIGEEPVRFTDVRVSDRRDSTDGTGNENGGALADGGNRSPGKDETASRDRSTPNESERRARNWYRLSLYRRLRPLRNRLRDPARLLTEHPWVVLIITVPLGVGWIAVSWWPSIAVGPLRASHLDDAFIQALVLVTGSFAISYEMSQRRVRAVEEAIPDFLDRLASTNEAGMSIVESFDRVIRSDLGALTSELEHTRADIEWGARVERALTRFRTRVETPAIVRVVTLVTNAMRATNDIGPVLRIAADEAKATRRLERDRRNELLAYTVVIYVSFLVFLVIIVVLDTVFIPSIPTASEITTSATPGGPVGVGFGTGIRQLTERARDAFRVLLFHAGIVQGYVSGFVAGQMEEGTVRAGAKHATIMIGIAYAMFLILG